MPRGIPRSSSGYGSSNGIGLRPDLIIQGVGSLVIGIIVTIVISAIFEESIMYGILVWILVGTPCCLITGISSVSTMLGTYDPLSLFGKSMRCDVTTADMNKYHFNDDDV